MQVHAIPAHGTPTAASLWSRLPGWLKSSPTVRLGVWILARSSATNWARFLRKKNIAAHFETTLKLHWRLQCGLEVSPKPGDLQSV
jgi:hypothetical protein